MAGGGGGPEVVVCRGDVQFVSSIVLETTETSFEIPIDGDADFIYELFVKFITTGSEKRVAMLPNGIGTDVSTKVGIYGLLDEGNTGNGFILYANPNNPIGFQITIDARTGSARLTTLNWIYHNDRVGFSSWYWANSADALESIVFSCDAGLAFLPGTYATLYKRKAV